jgi:hypothetical protein
MGPFIIMLLRALAVWALFILAESVQGSLRRAYFGADIPMVVRQVSVGLGVVLIFALAWVSGRWMRLRSQAGALAVGVIWVALTLVFEAAVASLAGERLAIGADYDPRRGGLMGFGLLAIAIAPWLVQRLQQARTAVGSQNNG